MKKVLTILFLVLAFGISSAVRAESFDELYGNIPYYSANLDSATQTCEIMPEKEAVEAYSEDGKVILPIIYGSIENGGLSIAGIMFADNEIEEPLYLLIKIDDMQYSFMNKNPEDPHIDRKNFEDGSSYPVYFLPPENIEILSKIGAAEKVVFRISENKDLSSAKEIEVTPELKDVFGRVGIAAEKYLGRISDPIQMLALRILSGRNLDLVIQERLWD